MRNKNICHNCIIEPICSDPCYKSFALVEDGMKVINWMFDDDPDFDAEVEYGVSKEELLDYFWQYQDGRGNVDLKFEDLKKLKRKTIKVAEIVHGRLYIEDMRAIVLPNKKLVVDIDELG